MLKRKTTPLNPTLPTTTHHPPPQLTRKSSSSPHHYSSLRPPPTKANKTTLLLILLLLLLLIYTTAPTSHLSNVISQISSDLSLPTLSSSWIKLTRSKSEALRSLNEMCSEIKVIKGGQDRDLDVEEEVKWYLTGNPFPSSVPDPSVPLGGPSASTWSDLVKERIDVVHCVDVANMRESVDADVTYTKKAVLSATLDPYYYYVKELMGYLGRGRVSVKFGDGKGGVGGGPTLRKVRRCGTDSNVPGSDGIVYKAESWRHFPDDLWVTYYEDKKVSWREKKNVASWRGSTTGCVGCYPDKRWEDYMLDDRGSTDGKGSGRESVENGGYGSRAELVRRMDYLNVQNYNGSPMFDIGVTMYNQGVDDLWGVKPFLTKGEQMGNKIIIIAEGNDVATGSKWAMLSGSVVVMAKPVICSWLLEEEMIPGVHYLEVKWDWSDLVEKVKWCFDNDDECEMIGKMGQCWMRRFLDEEREEKVIGRVMEEAMEMQKRSGYCA